jgi:hypothetical protein
MISGGLTLTRKCTVFAGSVNGKKQNRNLQIAHKQSRNLQIAVLKFRNVATSRSQLRNELLANFASIRKPYGWET